MNIFNDNETGHTATVSTPIKQGKSINKELSEIYKIQSQIDFNAKPNLVDELVKNSKSQIKITNVFVFNKIMVNGIPINNDGILYGMYIKEEVDPSKFQFGRTKLHYPISLKYQDDDLIIDNRAIMNMISRTIKDYAFVVNGFNYDTETNTLNFDVTIIGENKTPYSKIFINNKGIGNKYNFIFNEDADSYDLEIVELRRYYGQDVNAENYREYMNESKKKAMGIVENILEKEGYEKITNISSIYPYSVYDYECKTSKSKCFFLVFFTTTSTEYFNISSKKMKFINDFYDKTEVFLITDILKKAIVKKYNINEILCFTKSINSIMLRKG